MKIVWYVLSVLIATGIFISSSIPGDASGYASMALALAVQYILPISNELLNFLVRKAAHLVVYFLLAFCVAQSLKFHIHRPRVLLLSAWAIASLYGVTDEIHQFFVPDRVMAFLDILINAVGALAGAAFVVITMKHPRS